jgi:hypothetical protein
MKRLDSRVRGDPYFVFSKLASRQGLALQLSGKCLLFHCLALDYTASATLL